MILYQILINYYDENEKNGRKKLKLQGTGKVYDKLEDAVNFIKNIKPDYYFVDFDYTLNDGIDIKRIMKMNKKHLEYSNKKVVDNIAYLTEYCIGRIEIWEESQKLLLI